MAGEAASGSNSFMDSDTEDNDQLLLCLTPAQAAAKLITTAFDLPGVTKQDDSVNAAGKRIRKWYCGNCDKPFSSWNATKVAYHMARVKGGDIGPCGGSQKPEDTALYKAYFQLMIKKRDSRLAGKERLHHSIETRQEQLSTAIVATKKPRLKSPPSAASYFTPASNIATKARLSDFAARTTSYQTTLTTQSPNPKAETDLTVAIANLVYSEGLAFRFVEIHTLNE
jgi:hypothetical protein